MTQAQQVITIAGMLDVVGASDGPALEATFNNPHGLAVDDFGNIYIVDRFGHKVRKYSPDGNVTTLAGSGVPGNSDGIGLSASFNEPWGICMGNDGNIYVADSRNNLIRKVTPDGIVTTLAGSGIFGTSNGQGTNASFGTPTGIEMDEEGNLYVADHLTHVIRKISTSGYVTTVAGVSNLPGFSDGIGADALFNRPYGLTIDHNGDVLVADEWNHRIRKVTPSGEVTTIAGTGTIGHVNGQPFDAAFNYPWDVTEDDAGNIYVADGFNQVIRKLSPTGSIPESFEVTTYAGNPGESGGIDGFGFNAEFNAATSVQYWPQTGEIFVADAYNNLIRKIIDIARPPVELQMNSPVIGIPTGEYFCSGIPIELQVVPDSFDTYTFYINGEIAQQGPATLLSTSDIPAGNTNVTVIATDAIGSVVSNTIEFVIEDLTITDFAGDEIFLSENNDEVEFEAEINTSGEVDYFWSFGDVDSGVENTSILENPVHTYSGPGYYSVELIVGNDLGCVDTLLKEDYIYYRSGDINDAVFIPSAFTPNGDGKNDVLYVRGEEIAELEFFVYNQWGQLVFETNTQNQGWDGYFRGKVALSCTYTYLVRARLISGEEVVRTGHVSIIR